MKPHLRHRHRNSQLSCSLLSGHFMDFTEDVDIAITWVKSSNCAQEHLSELFFFRLHIGARHMLSPVSAISAVSIDRFKSPEASPPKMTLGFIERNSREPRTQSRLSPESAQIEKRLQQSFLDDVVGVRVISNECQSHPSKSMFVRTNQFIEQSFFSRDDKGDEPCLITNGWRVYEYGSFHINYGTVSYDVSSDKRTVRLGDHFQIFVSTCRLVCFRSNVVAIDSMTHSPLLDCE